MKKLYISDLDFTLLSYNSVLSNYSRKMVLSFLNKGVLFSIASARSLTTIKEILGDIPFSLPVITLNGAAVVRYGDGKILSSNFLSLEKTLFMKDFLLDNSANFIINTMNDEVNKIWMPTKSNESIESFIIDRREKKDPRLRLFSNVDEIDFSKEKVICFTVIEKARESNMLYESFANQDKSSDNSGKPRFNFYPMGLDRDGWQWMTIQDDEANKGFGVKFVADYAKIDKEGLVVFGDNVNDVSMFKLAGTSLAVKNGKAETKAVASKVIDYHYNDSVVKYIAGEEGI